MLSRPAVVAPLLVVGYLLAATPEARALDVGARVPDFRLKTAFGKVKSLASFPQPVMLVWYEGAKSRYQNTWLKNVGRRLRDAKLLDPRYYVGLGIANFNEHWASNWLIRQVIKSKQKADRTVILCDEDGAVRKAWGFHNGRSNVYLIDAQRRLRWKASGPITKARGRELWRLVVRLIHEAKKKASGK